MNCKSPSMHEEETRVAVLRDTVQRYLLRLLGNVAGELLILHQEVFAAGFDYAATVRLLGTSLAGKLTP